MKLHVVTKEEKHIEGHERIEVSTEGVNLDQYAENECSLILAPDCLDYFGFNEVQSFLIQARSKMRMKSKLVIGGTDIRLLSRLVIDGSIGTEEANQILFTKKSCADINTVTGILQHVGLKILTTKISGIHYEIEASR
jgi:hypothetical protein